MIHWMASVATAAQEKVNAQNPGLKRSRTYTGRKRSCTSDEEAIAGQSVGEGVGCPTAHSAVGDPGDDRWCHFYVEGGQERRG